MNWYIANYIIEKGAENIKEWTLESIEKTIKEIYEKEKKVKENGRISCISPKFQDELIRAAKKICDEDKQLDCIAEMISNSVFINKYIDVE